MRAFIKNYIEAEKARREEEGREAGFSLIELIVVVVILGILVAIAIPVFLNIQQTSKDNALDAAASNGAVVAATAISENVTTVAAINTELDKSEDDGYTLAVALFPAGTTVADLQNFCVTATAELGESLDGGVAGTSGPGCP
jgi:prepilin-type N-terminal cleavage/methylation domain-containing protein